ncbi:hypothetical protein J4417_04960 [Candidatus Woesearchaeota archaeon]|nr:hypothetical protein [Candidatus Woesearchaeota archaeon]
MVLTNEELLIEALEKIAPSFLADYNPERNTVETASDLTDFFLRNFKRAGVARFGKGVAVSGLLAVLRALAREEDYQTLETICKISVIFGGIYSFSAIDALMSAYQYKNLLNNCAESIVRRYYLMNR